jgi:hypothetical protein
MDVNILCSQGHLKRHWCSRAGIAMRRSLDLQSHFDHSAKIGALVLVLTAADATQMGSG